VAVAACVGVAVGRAGVELADGRGFVELGVGVEVDAEPLGVADDADAPGCALLLGEASVVSSWCKRTNGSRPNTSMLELTSSPMTTIQMVARPSTEYPSSPSSSQLLEPSKGNP
jgi:hypothetical protein